MVLPIKPERVEISNSARCSINIEPPQVLDVPGGLYPLHARAYELDEYRMFKGWPVSVPRYDIRANTMVSCEGEVLANREVATEIRTGAMIRWTADDEFLSNAGLRWSPVQAETDRINWTTTVANAPVLVDYEYRVGAERFFKKALNFDSDTKNYMEADFESILGGISGYTIIMVMSPNSIFDNNVDVPYNGLLCPKSKAGDFFDLTMQGNYLWLESESTDRIRAISINPQVRATAPSYIALVMDRPQATFYVGTGPDSVRVQRFPSGKTGANIVLNMYLGRSTEDLDHTADMALFDLGFYPDRLTPGEIHDEFAVLARAFGGGTG